RTVGVMSRGVQQYNIFNSFPTQSNRPALPGMQIPGTTNALPYWYFGQNLTTPQPGDGGYIYIGGNSLTSYSLNDPRQGSIIDDADASYMTRIEIEGGGTIDSVNANGMTGAPTIPNQNPIPWLQQKAGLSGPESQFNTAMAMTISNSNLANFQDAAVFAHPNAAN